MAALSPSEIDALGTRAEAMVNALGTISAEPDRLVRLFLTPEHRRAADRVAAWMREAGLEVSEDALGTVRGRLDGPQAAADRLAHRHRDRCRQVRRPVRRDRRHPGGGAFHPRRQAAAVRHRRAGLRRRGRLALSRDAVVVRGVRGPAAHRDAEARGPQRRDARRRDQGLRQIARRHPARRVQAR